MKKTFSINLFVLAIFLLSSCKKNEINYGVTELVAGKALLKFNYVSAYTRNPGVQLSINGNRVSNIITSRTPFPGGGYNTGGGSQPDYLTVAPGNVSIVVSIPKSGTSTDSIVLYQTNLSLEVNKSYTAHITDTSSNTKTVLAADDFTTPDSVAKARYKFVHLMPNVPAIDLYFGSTKVASNIPYLGVSDYFILNVPTSATAWSIREAGASPTSTALATYSSANTYLSQRVYTAFALGYKGLTDNVKKPYISFLLNR